MAKKLISDVLIDGDDLKKVIFRNKIFIQGSDVRIGNIEILVGHSGTKLSITARGGDKKAELGGLTGNNLGALNARTVILTGNIDLDGGLVSLFLDEINDNVSIETRSLIVQNFRQKDFILKANTIGTGVDFNLTGSIKRFQAGRFGDGSITANGIGKVIIKYGPFGADIIARTGDILHVSTSGDITGKIIAKGLIKKIATKAGDITGVIRAGGDILAVQAVSLDHAILSAGRNIGKVRLKGDIMDSYILAGYDIGTDGAFGLQAVGGVDKPGSGNIGSVIAKGTFARSYIGAAVLPLSPLTSAALTDIGLPLVSDFGSIGKVKFGSVDYSTAVDFGLFAATEIRPFKIGKTIAQSQGPFRVEIM